jgi:hypothetical protein
MIRNNKQFIQSMFLAFSFMGVLVLLFTPIFGEGRNGLQFADDMFNKLAKGSSYFIKDVAKHNEKNVGKNLSISVTIENPGDLALADKLLTESGAKVEANNQELKINADLGKTLESAIKDSDLMYNNDGGKISSKYGVDAKRALKTWWTVLSRIDKKLKKSGDIKTAKEVSTVMKKAIEPAYNFYGIEAQKVIDKIGILGGLLVFYILYTMWWGYAIYYFFEGIGLTMKKAKVKQEI